ncbi:unnamed protein product [Rotaria sordida]|uniref:EF-hand domain-containing protein n=1 Tax=Rotaria sordida TaxID=392033 RepID=A0A815GE41_9BILA|nr:unnamed protein product [Rotaria sordida]CAF3734462.1 unnamed protein product [Rotaria sordida]
MTTRTSSSSSSSESEVSRRERNFSETSRDASQSESRVYAPSVTNTIDATSLAETGTLRTVSSPISHVSGTASGTGYDSVSLTTATDTGFTNATTASQQQSVVGGIPIIRPPILQQQTSTGIGTFGPQRPTGYPTQPPVVSTNVVTQQPIRIDVTAAQQQYQQHGLQPEISPYSGSTVSTSGESISSHGTSSIQQQPRVAPAPNIVNPGNLNQLNLSGSQEFRPQSQGIFPQPHGQFFHHQQQQQPQTQQALLQNQIPAHQVYNELLGPDAFKDVILDIDYGAMGGFNAAFQSGTDFLGGQLPPGISVRPAYTTVDSLNYQHHMFNTARTMHAGGENLNFDFDGTGISSNIGGFGDVYGGQNFDAAKAVFNLADTNRDGSISRQEFQKFFQGGQQNVGEQSYSTTTNYQTNIPSYNSTNDNFYHAGLFAGADPTIATILQQSGLGQVVPNQ